MFWPCFGPDLLRVEAWETGRVPWIKSASYMRHQCFFLQDFNHHWVLKNRISHICIQFFSEPRHLVPQKTKKWYSQFQVHVFSPKAWSLRWDGWSFAVLRPVGAQSFGGWHDTIHLPWKDMSNRRSRGWVDEEATKTTAFLMAPVWFRGGTS